MNTTTMRAVVSYGSGQPLRLEQRPIPAIGANDLLLKIERYGICGSDLHAHDFLESKSDAGSILGHEISGTIAQVGETVSHFKVGQRIIVYTAIGCGTCKACQSGNATICPKAEWVSGGYAEYMRVPAAAAIALPGEMTAAQAALVEPLAVGLYGLRVGGLAAGETILVLGAGSIGLATIWWAKRLGAKRIVCMSRSARRADIARAMGADAFVAYHDDEVAEVAAALGGAPDVVAECIGVAGGLQRAVNHAGLFGRVVSLGLGSTPDPVVPAAAGMKGVSIYFPVGYSMEDFRQSAHAILDSKIDPQMMISSVISLEEVSEMFANLSGPHNQTKVHIAP